MSSDQNKGKRIPEDTQARMDTPGGSMEFLAQAMFGAGGSSAAIERMEAEGQTSLIVSDTLPKRCSADDKAALMDLGVEFGDEADDLFQFVTLPAGWRKVATGHSMWTDLVDADGVKRAAIFYKAAFYDRSANWYFERPRPDDA